MTFNDAAVFILVMFGGVLSLIAVIVAGAVTLSFLTTAEPILEPEDAMSETE